MPGKSERECGNYRNLDVETGRKICAWYADLIADWTAEKLAY
jgi:S-ribosylhomocysteine lyase